jgi:hypothetical protein
MKELTSNFEAKLSKQKSEADALLSKTIFEATAKEESSKKSFGQQIKTLQDTMTKV